ncbi:MAG TPA: hypothetical protein VHG90_14055, partial [Acidimicrobiales bacterium]|nr:hypothetical protein [Acidimicrobiales bacterium]
MSRPSRSTIALAVSLAALAAWLAGPARAQLQWPTTTTAPTTTTSTTTPPAPSTTSTAPRASVSRAAAQAYVSRLVRSGANSTSTLIAALKTLETI